MSSVTSSRTANAAEHFGKRIVVIDQTAPGGTSATGALKETYFGSLPAERILFVHDTGMWDRCTVRAGIADGFSNTRVYSGIDEPLALIRTFEPDIIVYRPLPAAPQLHRLASILALEDRIPLLLWFMDDWPERLRASDPRAAETIERDLRDLAGAAVGCFAISQSMAIEFRKRYGGPEYMVAHNGISLEDWSFPRDRPDLGEATLIRYSGSLAPDMTLDSVAELAKAVAGMASDGHPVRLEIRTQPYWLRQYGHRFKGLNGVSIGAAGGSQADYRRWIAGADIGVVAYNFDEETIRYTRYSFANKVPELMAAGSAVLAIGPIEIETIRYLSEHGVAAIADQPAVIRTTLQSLIAEPANRHALAAAAHDHSAELTLDAVRAEFYKYLEGPSQTSAGAPDAVRLVRNAPPAFARRALDWLHMKVRRAKWSVDDLMVRVSDAARAALRTNRKGKAKPHDK